MERQEGEKMAKKYTYSFAMKRQSEQGITSSILAGISILLFLIAAILSFVFQGEGGLYLGAMGLCAMCISIYGFGIGLKSFSKENRIYTFSKIGAIANGVLMIGWLGLFLTGV